LQFAGPAYTFPLTTDQLSKSPENKTRHAFAVICTYNNKIIGHCELTVKENSIHLGRILIGDVRQRGQGVGQIIVAQLLEFGFANFNKPLTELNFFDWNIPAIECYKKVGFTINPSIKAERRINAKAWVAINMTLSRQQWNSSRG